MSARYLADDVEQGIPPISLAKAPLGGALVFGFGLRDIEKPKAGID